MDCFECGQPADHNHHVIPLVLGGTKTLPLCSRCHSLVHSHPGLSTGALIKQGMAKARAKGVQIGRPTDRPDDAILKLRAEGMSIRKIAKALGLTARSVQRAVEKTRAS